jgi:hypothetical protein
MPDDSDSGSDDDKNGDDDNDDDDDDDDDHDETMTSQNKQSLPHIITYSLAGTKATAGVHLGNPPCCGRETPPRVALSIA